jgi:hypothetical protein
MIALGKPDRAKSSLPKLAKGRSRQSQAGELTQLLHSAHFDSKGGWTKPLRGNGVRGNWVVSPLAVRILQF